MKLSGDAASQQGILSLADRDLKAEVAFERAAETLRLNKLHLRHGRAALMGSGKLGLTAPRFFNFEGSLQHFDVSAFLQAPRTSLNATLKLAGELESPSGRGPEAKVEFRMGNSRIADHAVTGEGRVEFLGTDLATARGLGRSRITAGPKPVGSARGDRPEGRPAAVGPYRSQACANRVWATRVARRGGGSGNGRCRVRTTRSKTARYTLPRRREKLVLSREITSSPPSPQTARCRVIKLL